MEVLWCICVGIISFFVPRAILAIIGGIFFGGWWWLLFAPLMVYAVWIDLMNM